MSFRHKAVASVAALAVAVAGGLGIGYAVHDDVEEATQTITKVLVPGSPPVVLDGDAQDTAGTPKGADSHEDLRDETPPGVDQADVERIEESRPSGIGQPRPVGGAQRLACTFKPVVNFSSRATGSKVSMFVLHYTVSAPGSIDAIWSLFNTPSFEASSTYLLDLKDGKCYRLMDPDKKPWTQGAFNSVSESVEIVARGTESTETWKNSPIFKNMLLAELVLDRLRARGLPLRLVNPNECTPLAGYTDHNRLECGNTHTDVAPNFPFKLLQKQIMTLASGNKHAEWRAVSGGIVLARRASKDGVSGYDRILAWAKAHPGIVRDAEAKNGAVALKKAMVSG